MLLRKFKETSPDNIVLIFIVALAAWISSFINPGPVTSLPDGVAPMPLYGILEGLAGKTPFAGVLISFLLVLLISYLMVDFNTSEIFIGERTFLPALFYILLTSLFPHQQILNPVLPAALFLIFALKRIIDTYKVQGTAYHFFDAGLLISTGSLFYAGFIWYGLLIIVGIAILRTGNIKEIIISVIGLITPWFIAVGVLYLADADLNSLVSGINYSLFHAKAGYELSKPLTVFLAVISLILLIAMANLINHLRIKKIKSRKTFILLFWVFFISLGVLIIFKSVSFEIFWLAGIPAAYFFSHYFIAARKKIIYEVLFAVLFILVAAIQLLGKML